MMDTTKSFVDDEPVFGSLDMSRSNSMTSAGQCRLSPLIPCIQDASRLYDYCVKILFRLHSSLPPDLLTGHRERFSKQFKLLKKFYIDTNALQYFRNLITVPPLPENPPNFLYEAELRTYVTQEVTVVNHRDEEEQFEGNLIDTTDHSDHSDTHSVDLPPPPPVPPTPNQLELIAERDNLIQHLQHERESLRTDYQKLTREHQQAVGALQEQIHSLETDLATKESELFQEKQIREELFQQASAVAQSQDSEQKVKEEKFTKLKTFYANLRDQHVNLLREKALVDKKYENDIKKMQALEQSQIELQHKIRELELLQTKQHEQLQQSSMNDKMEMETLKRDKDLFQMEAEVLRKSIEEVVRDKNQISDELDSLKQQKQELDVQMNQLTEKCKSLQTQFSELQVSHGNRIDEIVNKSIQESERSIQHAVHEVDNPALSAVTCSPDYLQSLTSGCLEALKSASSVGYNEPAYIIIVSSRIAHLLAVYILQGRATSNTSPDIIFGEKMADACKTLGESILTLLGCLRKAKSSQEAINDSVLKLQIVTDHAETLSGSLRGEAAENIVDMIESELAGMDKAIEEAARQIQELLSKSRAVDSGIKLEVNEKILDSCTTLMQAIRILIQKARLLQAEIVSQGKGSSSDKEFYKRNHQWTDGFISAAKAVAAAAKFFLGAADKVVSGQLKLEQLVVGAQEIAASTAQLVVASRVKADRHSTNLQQLTTASKSVTKATGGVVATVKDCGQLIDETEELDTSKLTLHNAKRLEMEAQVRVLELEKDLEQERLRLAALRRHHYQLAGETE